MINKQLLLLALCLSTPIVSWAIEIPTQSQLSSNSTNMHTSFGTEIRQYPKKRKAENDENTPHLNLAVIPTEISLPAKKHKSLPLPIQSVFQNNDVRNYFPTAVTKITFIDPNNPKNTRKFDQISVIKYAKNHYYERYKKALHKNEYLGNPDFTDRFFNNTTY